VRAVILIASAAMLFADDTTKKDTRFFDKKVAPILTKRCLGCHNDKLNDGGVSFQDRETLFKRPVVVPGKPEQSLLFLAIQHNGDLRMPPGPKLPQTEIKTLEDWIRRGAPWGSKLRSH